MFLDDDGMGPVQILFTCEECGDTWNNDLRQYEDYAVMDAAVAAAIRDAGWGYADSRLLCHRCRTTEEAVAR
jgi:hypothetical protein